VLSVALSWLNLGIAAIPIRPGSKKPAARWQQYQKRLPSEHQLRLWFDNGRNFNLALVTGWQDLTVVDFDSMDAYKLWMSWAKQTDGIANVVAQHSYMVSTSRGVHVYVMAEEAPRGSIVRGQIDIKAGGGYVLAPPSIHPSGAQYEVLRPTGPIVQVADLQELFPFALHTEYKRPKLERLSVHDCDDPHEAAMQPCSGPDFRIDAIKSRIRIETLLARYGVAGRGRWLVCRCPFHDDHEPSFWIDVQEQRCGCYTGCTDKPLDVINLYARLHNLSNSEAIQELASSI